MNCPYCGTSIDDGKKFCTNCGAFLLGGESYSYGMNDSERSPCTNETVILTRNTVPEQYRPISPWAYFGYKLLFAIPVIGFIFLLIYTFDDSNINRRNFARSYWCALIIILIIVAVLSALGLTTGLTAYLLNSL